MCWACCQGRKQQQSVCVCFMDPLSHQRSLHEELKLTNTRDPVKCAQSYKVKETLAVMLEQALYFYTGRKKERFSA